MPPRANPGVEISDEYTLNAMTMQAMNCPADELSNLSDQELALGLGSLVPADSVELKCQLAVQERVIRLYLASRTSSSYIHACG
jgi:hypothetical protein